jgi:hypothetical protein
MISLIWIVLIICLCLSCVFIYVIIQSRRNYQPDETQRIKYSIQPSFDIITKKLNVNHSHRRLSDEEKLTQVRSNSLVSN